MDKGPKRLMEFQTLKGSGHSRVSIEDFPQEGLQRLALYQDRADRQALPSIVAFGVPQNQCVLSKFVGSNRLEQFHWRLRGP
jgi:hypothetical protein